MDFKSKELDSRYLLVSFLIGSVCAAVSIWQERSLTYASGRAAKALLSGILADSLTGILAGVLDIGLSCSIGVLLLGLSYLTQGGIGEGDGWFFLISGLFLPWKENLMLFCSGLVFCFLYSLVLVWREICRKNINHRRSMPFLPFLVPMGVYVTCFTK